MTLTQAQAWLAEHQYELTEDAGGGYEVWLGRERIARVFDSTRLLWWVLARLYRTGPPPNGASQAELIAWACAEAAAWPGTPRGVYTYWLRHVGRQETVQARRPAPRTQPAEPALAQATMEL